jgi:hypothetical protein
MTHTCHGVAVIVVEGQCCPTCYTVHGRSPFV